MRDQASRAYVPNSGFPGRLAENAEQLDPFERWYRKVNEALRYSLRRVAAAADPS